MIELLTETEIRKRIEAGDIVINPFDPRCLNPNSYDVHLHDELLTYRLPVLDVDRENPVEVIKIPPEGIVLQPGRLYLGRTVEHTETKNLIPMYDGRSSLGRIGLFSHITAGFGDIGFTGTWTLELTTVQPVRIKPGIRIGQLFFHTPDGEIGKTYDGKYQGQTDIRPSEMFKDFTGEVY